MILVGTLELNGNQTIEFRFLLRASKSKVCVPQWAGEIHDGRRGMLGRCVLLEEHGIGWRDEGNSCCLIRECSSNSIFVISSSLFIEHSKSPKTLLVVSATECLCTHWREKEKNHSWISPVPSFQTHRGTIKSVPSFSNICRNPFECEDFFFCVSFDSLFLVQKTF